MVDVAIVQARIERIRKCVARLQKLIETHPKEDFLGNTDAVDIAEHNLQTAIQCVLDIGNHVLADMRAGMPDDHRKIFTMLASQGVLSEDLASRLAQMAGLRNVLVHDYLEIDLDQLYRTMSEELDDFEEFIKAIVNLL